MYCLPTTERDRRWELLQRLIDEHALDGLILAGNDYRGHKGTLRWVGDLNLAHRYGYAVVLPDQDPRLILPLNLAMNPRGGWNAEINYARRLSDGLVDAVASQAPRRIGVVGLGQVMKVEDYLALRERLPGAEIIDVGAQFERVRAAKSAAELEGVREANAIAERCFNRLLEVAAAGVAEREIGAEVAATALAQGGEDLLFLTMYGRPLPDGTVEGHFGQPAGRVLTTGDMHIFSFELVGPLGYWMEFSRMICMGEPDERQQRVNAAVRAGLQSGGAALRAGAAPGAAQQAIVDAVEAHGASCAYWSGHGIGQDVIEEPWVGLDVVQDRNAPEPFDLQCGMVLALHPYVIDHDRRAIGYMADTFVVGAEGAEPVSAVSREIWSR